MPSTITVKHPYIENLTMTFTEWNHLYKDSENRTYMSVTNLVKHAFEPFDAEKAANMRAARTR